MFGIELIGIPTSFEKIAYLTDPRLLVEGPPANSIAHKDVNVRGATSSINSSKRLRVEKFDHEEIEDWFLIPS